jgi:hypothetical protein
VTACAADDDEDVVLLVLGLLECELVTKCAKMCEPFCSVLLSIAPLVSTTFLARIPPVHVFGDDCAHYHPFSCHSRTTRLAVTTLS